MEVDRAGTYLLEWVEKISSLTALPFKASSNKLEPFGLKQK